MHRSLRALSSALLAGFVLTAFQAEARFGKSSPPESSKREEKRDSDTHDASAVKEGREHASSPVTRSTPSRRSEPSRRRESRPPPSRSDYQEPYDTGVEVYYTQPVPAPAYVLAPAPAYGSTEYTARRSKNFLFGFDTQVLRGGSAAGLHVGVEGEEVGAMFRVSGLTLRTDDGTQGEDKISVVGMHMSWAALKGQNGRLRMEGGLSIAKAPDVTFVGPSLGLSSELYLLDSLALEGRVHVTPVPYRQLDAAGGVAWYVLGNVVALRGGMRMLVLDDAGQVDGVVHRDVLPGPYVSIGLAL
ncbi:hypothetical protein [Melittangium boletus]|uniref:Uncharacterized protein n=1 Tax=Melittangium boletus DSM 14713 TaxID=1294270 RepID=A0A250IPU6_9BACT|nr:hypothetical protein [Melittangium boletus]ATB33260.1 hypothetical protein MEBOL_006751 [Melittangium boletus DSM 14713]